MITTSYESCREYRRIRCVCPAVLIALGEIAAPEAVAVLLKTLKAIVETIVRDKSRMLDMLKRHYLTIEYAQVALAKVLKQSAGAIPLPVLKEIVQLKNHKERFPVKDQNGDDMDDEHYTFDYSAVVQLAHEELIRRRDNAASKRGQGR